MSKSNLTFSNEEWEVEDLQVKEVSVNYQDPKLVSDRIIWQLSE